MDEETGEVVVQYHATDIVRVNVSGDVKITSGGYHTVRLARLIVPRLRAIELV